MKILTKYSPPPVPTNQFDWSAWYDGDEELGIVGYGKTESEAITDLLDRLEQ